VPGPTPEEFPNALSNKFPSEWHLSHRSIVMCKLLTLNKLLDPIHILIVYMMKVMEYDRGDQWVAHPTGGNGVIRR
jgi:hypothetical protein